MVNDGQNLINVVKERPLFVPMTLWSYGCIYALFEMKPLRRYDYYTLLHLSIDLSTETVHGWKYFSSYILSDSVKSD